jgi:hypothetical protein
MERLSKEVDLWVCHTEDFNIDDVEYFRQKGLQTRFYGPMIYEQEKNSGCGSNTPTVVILPGLLARRQ